MSDGIELPSLTNEQIKKVCDIAEKAAREHIFFGVPPRWILDLDITVDVEGAKQLTVNVDVELSLSPLARQIDVNSLADEAVEKAVQAVEKELRELSSCKSKRSQA